MALRENTVVDSDHGKVKIMGVVRRHGFTIFAAAFLGAAAGVGIGYLVAMKTGYSKQMAMAMGGVAGFVVIGGITYALCHSIDKAEAVAVTDCRNRMTAAGLRPAPATTAELVNANIAAMQEMGRQIEEAEREARRAARSDS